MHGRDLGTHERTIFHTILNCTANKGAQVANKCAEVLTSEVFPTERHSQPHTHAQGWVICGLRLSETAKNGLGIVSAKVGCLECVVKFAGCQEDPSGSHLQFPCWPGCVRSQQVPSASVLVQLVLVLKPLPCQAVDPVLNCCSFCLLQLPAAASPSLLAPACEDSCGTLGHPTARTLQGVLPDAHGTSMKHMLT
eukprot:1143575-Pelagomonas_calceolata.AAC.2